MQLSKQTPAQRRAHAAKIARTWYHSPAGKAYQKIVIYRLFHPDWKRQPGKHNWTLREDVDLLTYNRTTRQIARAAGVTIPAALQRRVRLRRLSSVAAMHARLSAEQQEYLSRLRRALRCRLW